MWIISTFVFAAAFLVTICICLNEREKVRKMSLDMLDKQVHLNKALKSERNKNLKTYNELIGEYESEIRKITAQFKSEVNKLAEYNISLQNGLDLYKEQQRRALILHPDLESEIDRMIKNEIIQADIEKAHEFDKAAEKVAFKAASRYMVEELEMVFDMYNKLSEAQKQYVATDMEKLSYLYQASNELQKAHLKRQKEEEDKQIAKKSIS